MSRRPVRGAARLAAILDALPDALLLIDQNGVIVNANTRALEQFETSASPLVGLPVHEVLPDYAAPPPDGEREPAKPVRMTAVRTDGEAFRAEATTCYLPIEYDDELTVLLVRNLSDSYDVESELVRQQRQTELILRATTEGIIGVDNDCRIVLVNPAAARILGYRASDLGGQDFRELLHHSRADGTAISVEECPVSDTLRTGRKHRVSDEVLWRRDGQPVFVEMSSAPVREGDSFVGAVITFSDQSQVKAVARRNDELVSILDNELRRPLNTLYREVSELADDGIGELGPTARRMIRHVLGEFERMSRLVHDVLDYQRFETGNAPLNRQAVELEKILRFAVEATSSLARNTGVDILTECTPLQLMADSERITQALGHLIADAVSSSPPGSAVEVVAERRGHVARIEVRGPASNRSALHLPIARGIIERHGGFVQVLELPGHGTTYVVELPVELTGRALSAQVAKEATAAQLPGHHTTALAAVHRPELPAGGGGRRGADSGRLHGPWRPGEDDDEAAAEVDAPEERAASTGTRVRGAHARPGAGLAIPEQGRPGQARSRPDQARAAQQRPGEETSGDAEDVVVPRRARIGRPAPAEDDRVDAPLPSIPSRRRAIENPAHATPSKPGARRLTAEEQDTDAFGPHAEALPTVRRRFRPSEDQPEWSTGAAEADEEENDLGVTSRTGYVSRRRGGGSSAAGPRTPSPRRGDGPEGGRDVGGRGRVGRDADEVGAEQRGGEDTADEVAASTGRRRLTPVTETTPADAVTRAYQVPPEILRRHSVMNDPTKPVQVPHELLAAMAAEAQQLPTTRGRRGVGRHAEQVPVEPPEERSPDSGGTVVAPVLNGSRRAESAVEQMGRPLLVWPEPEESTARVLTEHGYVPVPVATREEIASLAGGGPAALFVDPLTGPITRTALQSLRSEATTANIPVLVTAGLAEAPREAAGADPAVLLRALAAQDGPRPVRVMLIEDNRDIAEAFAASLERRGMEVYHAVSENEAVVQASQQTPHIVVSDLLLLRRRRVGVVDWLRQANLLARTPIVVYTSVDIDRNNLRQLKNNETVLFVAERSTRDDIQQRLVDILGKLSSTR